MILLRNMNKAASFAAGELKRVGGLNLTQRAIELCCFAPGARLADIGCGQGATVRYLRASGFAAHGLDCDEAAIAAAGPHCRLGNASSLPWAAQSFDGLLFECSLSTIDDKEQTLAEAGRVLKSGGRLIISDLYALQESTLPNRGQWLSLIEQAGFTITMFEDRQEDLKELAAQLIWQYGKESVNWDYGPCSYFLLLARF